MCQIPTGGSGGTRTLFCFKFPAPVPQKLSIYHSPRLGSRRVYFEGGSGSKGIVTSIFVRKKVITSFTMAHQSQFDRGLCRRVNGLHAEMLSFLSMRVGFDPTVARIKRFSVIEPCVSQKTARLLNKKRLREGSIQVSVLS